MIILLLGMGLTGGSMVKNPPAKEEMWVLSLDQEDLVEKEIATHSSILAGKSHGWRNLVDCSLWGHKKELDMI